MIASGPYTFKNSLAYNGLNDLISIAKKEQPQAIILLGPFLDIAHQDMQSGDLYFVNPVDQTRNYISHEDLFKDLISTIQKGLAGLKTKVILVPSHKDIHHFEPIPQVPFSQHYLQTSSTSPQFICVSNPCTIQLNDIKIGKDMCSSMYPKNMEPPKIDLSLKGILQQRLFYPLYPPNQETPIEYEQIDSLYIKEMPDIMITPSDLIQFVKVRRFHSITYKCRTSMGASA